ncbi:MAG: NAD(P)-binding domain-containing protein, partial [Thermoplasmata archaeon]|nr:NAD(P)-binding domain-containing protein [Thermoplasmata archaeon]
MTAIHDLSLDPLDVLAGKIRERTATAAVIGLGYVGLPLLVAIANAGFPVIGIDRDEDRIASLTSRRSHVVTI